MWSIFSKNLKIYSNIPSSLFLLCVCSHPLQTHSHTVNNTSINFKSHKTFIWKPVNLLICDKSLKSLPSATSPKIVVFLFINKRAMVKRKTEKFCGWAQFSIESPFEKFFVGTSNVKQPGLNWRGKKRKRLDGLKCDRINKKLCHRIHLLLRSLSTLRLLSMKNFNFVFVIPLVCCVFHPRLRYNQ